MTHQVSGTINIKTMNTTLEEYRDLAVNAYRGTSFDPEKRGVHTIKEYEKHLAEALEEIKSATDEEKEWYVKGYKKRFSAWMGAKSRCLSTMITGPANFPVRRNEKANRSEEKRGDEFFSYHEWAVKKILKAAEARKPESQKNDEAWIKYRKNILGHVATIVRYDLGIDRTYTRRLFVNAIVKPIETNAKNGKVEMVKRALELLREVNDKYDKPIIALKSKVWGMEVIAEENKADQEHLANQENKEYQYDGFKVILNYKEDRLQIQHEEKPDRSVIEEIKSHGFRWSPKGVVWQRKLTNNAMYVTFKLLLKDEKIIK